MFTTIQHNQHTPQLNNNEYVNVDLSISSFVLFKRKLIALKKYSVRSVIKPNVLDGFCSTLLSGSTLNIKFWCNTEIKTLLNSVLYS